MSSDNFIAETKAIAKENGVSIRFGRGKRIRLPVQGLANGSFDGEELAVAVGKSKSDWLPIMVHESCHMDQCLEKSKFWVKNLDASYDKIELYLAGEEVPGIAKALNIVVALEADCERRACEKIKKYQLMSVEKYAQLANSYLLFHKAIFKYRKWYHIAPYELPRIWRRMPTYILPTEEYYMKSSLDFDVSIFERCLTHTP